MNNILVVVDMINGFINEGVMHDKRINAITPTIIDLINKFTNNNTYFIADSHSPNAIEFNTFPKHCVKGTNEELIINELQEFVNDNNLINKNSVNTFFNFYKKNILKDNNIYIVGCCSDICVLQFALTLNAYIHEYNLNNKVYVVSDAIDTYNNDNHNSDEYNLMAIKIMSLNGINIINSREVL